MYIIRHILYIVKYTYNRSNCSRRWSLLRLRTRESATTHPHTPTQPTQPIHTLMCTRTLAKPSSLSDGDVTIRSWSESSRIGGLLSRSIRRYAGHIQYITRKRRVTWFLFQFFFSISVSFFYYYTKMFFFSYRKRLSRVHCCTRQKLDSVVFYYYKILRLQSLFTRLRHRFSNYQHPKRGNINDRFRESQNNMHLMSLFYYFIETRICHRQGTVIGEYNIQSC